MPVPRGRENADSLSQNMRGFVRCFFSGMAVVYFASSSHTPSQFWGGFR